MYLCMHGKKISVTYTQYFKSRELYNFQNFSELMQNSLVITTKLSRLIPEQFFIIFEKFPKLYNYLLRNRLYPLNYFFPCIPFTIYYSIF